MATQPEAATEQAYDTPFLAPDTKRFSGNYLLWRKIDTDKGQQLRRGGGGNPRFRHPTYDAAEAEAKRLLALFPESTFVILQEIGRVKLKAII